MAAASNCTRSASPGSKVIARQRANHASSRRIRLGSTRPRATNSSASLAASARNRSESPSATPGRSGAGRPSRTSTAGIGPSLTAGTTQGFRRIGAPGLASSSARNSCGDCCGPSRNEGSASVSSRSASPPGTTAIPKTSKTRSNSGIAQANGCTRGRGLAGVRPRRFGAVAGSPASSPHTQSSFSRDQMPWSAITCEIVTPWSDAKDNHPGGGRILAL